MPFPLRRQEHFSRSVISTDMVILPFSTAGMPILTQVTSFLQYAVFRAYVSPEIGYERE